MVRCNRFVVEVELKRREGRRQKLLLFDYPLVFANADQRAELKFPECKKASFSLSNFHSNTP